MYRVEIDKRLCSGTSNCVEDAPLAFEIGPDSIARLLPNAPDEDALIGARSCPLVAILVYDATTGQRIYP